MGVHIFGFMARLAVVLRIAATLIGTYGQEIGFHSIDCGLEDDYYQQTVTGLTWLNDSTYILTGQNAAVQTTIDQSLDNSDALANYRYFPEQRSKHCYELTELNRRTPYLVRAMFYMDDLSHLNPPIKFNVSINATNWFTIEYDTIDEPNTPRVFEGIFYSPGSVMHVCLVRDKGVPFISSLESRALDHFSSGGMHIYSYNGSDGEQYLYTLQRWNAGADLTAPTLRYPADQFDRLWRTPGNWNPAPLYSDPNVQLPVPNTDWNDIPTALLKDAWMDDSVPNFWFDTGEFPVTFDHVYVGVYVYELSPNATDQNVRGFDVALNGIGYLCNASNQLQDVLFRGWPVGSSNRIILNFTQRDWSTLGPIVNALELYAQYPFDNSTTSAQDAEALNELQGSFGLLDWQGDPCYPVPFDWVVCDTSSSVARINKLLLSRMNISGSIPSSISQLDALIEIHLDNNNLNGTIPDTLSQLKYLRTLSLDDNNLSGIVSTSLEKQGFTYSGNPLLKMAPQQKAKSKVGIIAGGTVGGVLGLVVVSLLIGYFLYRQKRKESLSKHDQTNNLYDISSQDHIFKTQGSSFASHFGKRVGYFRFADVVEATNNFKRQIGEGGYGPVYFGKLPDGKEVAVKKNNNLSNQGSDEFTNEVDLLTRIHHKNLVSLVGYCNDGDERILIYEYQSNGTLQNLLCKGPDAGQTIIDWKTRLNIALNAAKGLEYLHTGCSPPVIHRDVKSSNILLDDKLVAKVADFGISKSTPNDIKSSYTTNVKGSHGYLDPEYYQLQRLSQKSDVYSFGVVLFEIISGRPPVMQLVDGIKVNIKTMVQRSLETNNIHDIADPALEGNFGEESMWKVVDIAWSSMNEKSANRPDMGQIVQALAEAYEMESNFLSDNPLITRTRSLDLIAPNLHPYGILLR